MEAPDRRCRGFFMATMSRRTLQHPLGTRRSRATPRHLTIAGGFSLGASLSRRPSGRSQATFQSPRHRMSPSTRTRCVSSTVCQMTCQAMHRRCVQPLQHGMHRTNRLALPHGHSSRGARARYTMIHSCYAPGPTSQGHGHEGMLAMLPRRRLFTLVLPLANT